MDDQLAQNIVDYNGFTHTNGTGSYLGVPLLHQRVNKHSYTYLIDRVQKRLAGWKTDKLSLTKGITLRKVVLTSLPIYTTQTAHLPVTICEELDKIYRNLVRVTSHKRGECI